MKKLSLERMEGIQGGEDCFQEMYDYWDALDAWYSEPSAANSIMRDYRMGMLYNCMNNIP